MFEGREIRKWKPIYTRVIGYYLLGWTQRAIAEELGIHVLTVGRVINSAEGKRLVEESKDRVLREVETEATPKLTYIQKRAIEEMADFVDNDELKEKSPFAFVDRMMKMATLSGDKTEDKLPAENKGIQIGNAIIVNAPASEMSQVLQALRESQNKKEILPESFDTTKKLSVVK